MPYDIASIMIPATVEVNFAVVSACLPMMRPVVQKFVHGSPFGSVQNPSSGGGTHAGGTTSTGVKLRTMTKAIELDDNSSTQNLADQNYTSSHWADAETRSSGSAEEVRRDSEGTQERGARHGEGVGHGSRTVIKTTASRANGPDNVPTGKGIHIKNEMSVSYENA